ncbi:MAG: hypothetical protein RLZZ252_1039 [Bacteroidota bacterium]|jgi:hypothetical protein
MDVGSSCNLFILLTVQFSCFLINFHYGLSQMEGPDLAISRKVGIN